MIFPANHVTGAWQASEWRSVEGLTSHSTDRPDIVYSLPARSHNKSFMCKTSDLNEHNFLVRVIYKDCY